MKKIVLSLTLLLVSVFVFAQNMDEIANMPAEKFDKAYTKAVQHGIIPNKWTKGEADGSGVFPVMTKLEGVPKKVALVTFYVFDIGTVGTNMTGSEVYTTSITTKGGNKFANSFFAEGIEPIKAAFKARGMEVLLPGQFLDTPEKRQQFFAFYPTLSKLTKLFESGRRIGEMAAADDFHFMYLSDGRDFKLSESMGDSLCKILGVDAVLSVINDVSTDGQYFSLGKVQMVMHGPNPVKRLPDHKYIGAFGAGYQSGLLYQATIMDINRLFMQKHPKKGIVYENYKGYDKIAGLMAKVLANNVADRIAGKLGDGKD
jgi:hypothetical protein